MIKRRDGHYGFHAAISGSNPCGAEPASGFRRVSATAGRLDGRVDNELPV